MGCWWFDMPEGVLLPGGHSWFHFPIVSGFPCSYLDVEDERPLDAQKSLQVLRRLVSDSCRRKKARVQRYADIVELQKRYPLQTVLTRISCIRLERHSNKDISRWSWALGVFWSTDLMTSCVALRMWPWLDQQRNIFFRMRHQWYPKKIQAMHIRMDKIEG